MLRSKHVRAVAASSFTAGALAQVCPATVLPPGLSQDWFDTLVRAGDLAKSQKSGLHLVTAFRLASWQGKGLPQLLAAIASLKSADIHLTVCGSGRPPPDLLEALRAHPSCSLLTGLSDSELARELADADLFVLATRTTTSHPTSGEGFGLVLLEAQVAGTPVLAPARGGSRDAYVDQMTGIAPTDESADALASVLDNLLRDPKLLSQMGGHAADWARMAFEPRRYASLVIARLL
jgi:glycosyltransferase involved in cell wall biosynthesis